MGRGAIPPQGSPVFAQRKAGGSNAVAAGRPSPPADQAAPERQLTIHQAGGRVERSIFSSLYGKEVSVILKHRIAGVLIPALGLTVFPGLGHTKTVKAREMLHACGSHYVTGPGGLRVLLDTGTVPPLHRLGSSLCCRP